MFGTKRTIDRKKILWHRVFLKLLWNAIDEELSGGKGILFIGSQLRMVKLALVEKKTKALLITNRRKNNMPNVRVSHRMVSKPTLKYLGVMIDVKLSFKKHLDYLRGKAEKEMKFISSEVGAKY